LAFFNRFPKVAQLAPVYALTVLLVYGWTIMWFFWKLPSWLFFMTIGEILGVVAYAMAMNLLESLCVLLIPILLSVALPQKWFYDRFVARGAALALLLLGYAMFFITRLQIEEGYPKSLLLWSVLALFVIALLVYLVGKVPIVCKLLETLSDRAIVFLYLFIPISLVSFLVVIFRNLFWGIISTSGG
jgi:hypothetical protein